jgi:eukaryotic-like serine/threonine-protein kinase
VELKRDTRLGKYNIRARIGDGGMGIVYRAFDEHLQRPVAIKTIQGDKASDREFLNRFKREAFAIARFEDPHIVRLLDFVEGTEDEPPYMVMELLEGKDLSKIIAKTGPLAVNRAVDRILEVVAAVTKCHRFGYVHRDLKPSNIFIAEYNQIEIAKVLDFGAAKQDPRKKRRDPELTQKGDVWGTPFYMAPEQLSGVPASPLSDQYSIGVILYNTLTGKKPFDVDDKSDFNDVHLLAHIKQGTYIALRDHRGEVPPGLAAAIARAMSVDPGKRFPDLHEFGAELRAYASPQAQLTWERHFTSSIPNFRDPQMSIAIKPGDEDRTQRDNPFDHTTTVHDRTFPPPGGSPHTAPTVAGRSNIELATTARREAADPSLSLPITVDDPSSRQGSSPSSDTPIIRKESTSKALRNRPLLIVGGVVVLFGGVLGTALFVAHRQEPASRIASPPPTLLDPSVPRLPEAALPAHPIAPAPVPRAAAATTPPAAPASTPLASPPPPAVEAPKAQPDAPSAAPKHHHKKVSRATLDPHGIPIPTD